ncbi:MAG: hypothetical protein IJC15_04305, partial [Clostridia bacterium]|nr:hypothetical protein [Clostridia bacterium]
MAKLSVDPHVRGKARLVILVFVCAFLLLTVRVLAIQIGDFDRYQQIVVDQLTREATINAERGDIYDTNMEVLATNVTVWRVFISPKDIVAGEKERLEVIAKGGEAAEKAPRVPLDELIADGLSEILGVSRDEVLKQTTYTNKQDRTIVRDVEEEQADQVRAFIDEYGLESQVHLEAGTKRAYLYDNLAAHVLGFTGAEGTGLFGLEKKYDEQLSGEAGQYIIAR